MRGRKVSSADRGAGGRLGPRGHVLLVEDHVDARMLVEEFLEAHGFATSVTKTVAEGLALLRSDIAYDVVLLDLQLPGASGLELLAQLRGGAAPLCHLPVVVVSAHAPERIPGATAVLPKPIDLGKLLDLVEQNVRPRA